MASTAQYEDFKLKIGRAPEGRYSISVIESGAGELGDLEMTLAGDVADLARRFDAVRRARGARAARIGAAPMEGRKAEPVSDDGEANDADADQDPASLGRELYDLIFPRAVERLFAASVASAGREGRRVRIRLWIDPPELSALPWEFVFDPRSGGGNGRFVGLEKETPITRFPPVEAPRETLTISPPLRILAMIASPEGPPKLDTAREKALMQQAVEERVKQGLIDLQWVAGGTLDALRDALRASPGASSMPDELRGPWHVFHFIGHGDFDDEEGEGFLALCDAGGSVHRVSAETLARELGDHESLRLVVLNSCKGAQAAATRRFSSLSARIMEARVPAVIAMQFEISDDAALRFSRDLYDYLAEKAPLEEAVTAARKAIEGGGGLLGQVEWGTPVLSMRSPDGQLFTLDLAQVVFQGQRGSVGASQAASAPPAAAPIPPPIGTATAGLVTGQGRDARKDLRRLVRQGWIKGKLEPELEEEALMDVGFELLGDDGSGGAETGVAPGDDTLSAAKRLRATFRESGQSLLILGEPGAGKTIAMLTLLRDMLDESDADPSRPIPVPFTLDSWARNRQPLGEWMVGELSEKFNIPMKMGRQYVFQEYHVLLPCLDGLDEIRDAETRAACLQAINDFRDGAFVAGTLVCSRYKEYVDLPNRLAVNSAILLKRLAREQVLQFVAAGGEALAALDRTLRRDSALLIEACAPLMLRFLVRAYRGLTVEQVDAESAESASARRRAVFDAYVARQFRRAGGR